MFSLRKILWLSVSASYLFTADASAATAEEAAAGYLAASPATQIYLPYSAATVVIAQSIGIDPAGVPAQLKLSNLATARTVSRILDTFFSDNNVITSTTIVFSGSSGSLTNGGSATITSGARLLTLFSPASNNDNFYLLVGADRLGLLLQAVFGLNVGTFLSYTGGSRDEGVVLTSVLNGVFGGTPGNRTSAPNNPVFGGGASSAGSSPSGLSTGQQIGSTGSSSGSFGNITAGASVAAYYGTYAHNDDTQFLNRILQDLIVSTPSQPAVQLLQG